MAARLPQKGGAGPRTDQNGQERRRGRRRDRSEHPARLLVTWDKWRTPARLDLV